MRDEQEQSRIRHELTRQDRSADPFAEAMRVTRSPMMITDPNQPDNPVIFANGAFSELTGFDSHEIVGRNCRFLQGPETDRGAVARLRQAIDARAPIDLELLNYRKDGTTFWNRLLVSPVFDDEGKLTYFVASQFNVTSQRGRIESLQRDRDDLEAQVGERTADLAESENRLSFALDAAQLGSWTLDIATERMTSTDKCKENFGRRVSDPFTYEDIKAATHPDDRKRREDAVRVALEETGLYDCEYRILTPAGHERWLFVRGQVLTRADGTPLMLVGVSQDITERKRDEGQRVSWPTS